MARSDYGLYVAWIGVAIILIYAVLKSIGVIQSPPWQEMAPYFGAAVAFGGMISTIRQHSKDISDVKREIKNAREELKSEIKEVSDKVIHLDKDVEVLKDRLGR